MVMNFWFIECKPCIREMSELNNLVKKYKNKEVVFLGFSGNGKRQIASFLETKDFFYTIIPNSRKIASTYNVSGYPTNIIIDKNLKISYSTRGLKPITIHDMDKAIAHLVTN